MEITRVLEAVDTIENVICFGFVSSSQSLWRFFKISKSCHFLNIHSRDHNDDRSTKPIANCYTIHLCTQHMFFPENPMVIPPSSSIVFDPLKLLKQRRWLVKFDDANCLWSLIYTHTYTHALSLSVSLLKCPLCPLCLQKSFSIKPRDVFHTSRLFPSLSLLASLPFLSTLEPPTTKAWHKQRFH